MLPEPFGLAYVDPGTGSFLWQLAVGSALGAAFAVKTQWRRLKSAALRLLGGSGNAHGR